MNLTTLFTTPQLTSLLHESDTELVLSCLDPQTGSVTHVTVKADMVAVPSEALLFATVDDERVDQSVPEHAGDYVELDCPQCSHSGMVDADGVCWFPMPVSDDEAEPCGCRCVTDLNEVEPPPLWAITPRGEEIDLRDIPNGLF